MSKKPYREVSDNEITPYQGWGDEKAMQKAQSRKRRQIRNQERGLFDDVPKEWQAPLRIFIAVMCLAFLYVLVAPAL